MMNPADAATLQILETQLRELTLLHGRLEHARATLMPRHSQWWRGTARGAYDSAIDAVEGTVDAGIAALRSAMMRTGQAVWTLASRG
ncbi:MAG: hypothetical protein LH471_01550 [Salinibacterium sp.]|nr:hypothetical protein [Salinibacterium sp.]